MLATNAPFSQFFDADGSPLDGGKLYFGTANQNPETNPITVYWDAAGTQPAAQPIPTQNGYTVRAGTPAIIYVPSDFSMTVRDRKNRIVYFAAQASYFNVGLQVLADLASPAVGKGSSLVAVQDAANNFAEVAAVKNVETVLAAIAAREYGTNIRKYGGAPGASGAVNSAALTAAFAASKVVFVPPGSYTFATGVTMPVDATLISFNPEATVLTYAGAGAFLTTTNGGYAHIEGVSLYGPHTNPSYFNVGTKAVSISGNLTMRRCDVRYWEHALDWVTGGFYLKFWDCQFVFNQSIGYNLPANNTTFFGCKAAFCDYVVQCGGYDGPLSWIGGSIENVTTAGFALIGGATPAVQIIGTYIENVPNTSVAGTGLNAAGYTAAFLVQGAWKNIAYHGCDGQMMGFRRITSATSATLGNFTDVGSRWIYKLDAGVSDMQYGHALGDSGNVLITSVMEARSDVSYTPSPTFTPQGVLLSQPRNAVGWDPISGNPLSASYDHQTLTYSASMTADRNLGSLFSITVTNNTAFTINDALHPYKGARLTYTVRNASGGALGAVTWGSAYKMSAWTSPANGFSRSITFAYNGSNWIQIEPAGVDIPN